MTLQVLVSRIWDETPEIRCFELKPAEADTLPPFAPGAHVEVRLAANLVRQYSLWNGPDDDDRYLIGVKREPASRGGSTAMHALAEGDRIEIDGPKNNFPLASTPGPSLLLAGGVGVTPLLCMARHLRAEGRPCRLNVFTRSVAMTPFRDLFDRDPSISTYPGLVPPDLDAVLHRLLLNRTADAHVYICGPGPFMELARRLATQVGWADSAIHLEYFSVAPKDDNLANAAFELVLQRSGRTLTVDSGQTIIEALRNAGVEIVTSCEQGVCGTCVTTVLAGDPDHRDSYFNVQERASGKVITPCVSRCRGKQLVLDL